MTDAPKRDEIGGHVRDDRRDGGRNGGRDGGRDGVRYDFGRNWADFAATLTPAAIDHAVAGVRKLCGSLDGLTFLDIGSGSGVHSLAAARLGAAVIHAIDYDRDSVATTTSVLRRHAPDASWIAQQGDILALTPEGRLPVGMMPAYDVVYSWGVLHHTGDMWRAIDRAASFVKPGGRFVVALYLKTPLCPLWRREKYLYSRFAAVRPLLRWPFAGALLGAASLRRMTSPAKYLRAYKTQRGMSFLHDVDDWLGGYPYQSVDDAELVSAMAGKGFDLQQSFNTTAPRGLFGSGCGEWVFRRRAA